MFPITHTVKYRCATIPKNAAADIETDRVITDEITFIAKVLSLFLSVSVLILAVVIEVMNHDIITPINKMARAAGNLVFDDGKGQKDSLAFLRNLGIKSEDEVGDFYRFLDKMATDTAEHIKEVKHKEPFSFEKAAGIIREESGTHFDTDVAAAFLNISERFRDKL